VFNLVRGLQKEIDDNADTAPVLQPLKDRAERILKDLDSTVICLGYSDQPASLQLGRRASCQNSRLLAKVVAGRPQERLDFAPHESNVVWDGALVEAIANGNAPADLTVTMLARALPHGWAAQELT
jgi:hypothetical protein